MEERGKVVVVLVTAVTFVCKCCKNVVILLFLTPRLTFASLIYSVVYVSSSKCYHLDHSFWFLFFQAELSFCVSVGVYWYYV